MTGLVTDYRGRHTEPDDGDGRPGNGAPVPTAGAVGVEVDVVAEKGQWAVDIIVIFEDGVVRRRIETYRTEALARISAGYIKRAAERDIGGPING